MKQLVFESVHDVPHSLCGELEAASFGPNEMLYKSFREIKYEKAPQDGIVVVNMLEKSVVGWGILIKYDHYGKNACNMLMLYVHSRHRNNGIGKSIVKRLLSYTNNEVLVWPTKSSGGNAGFFSKVQDHKLISAYNGAKNIS